MKHIWKKLFFIFKSHPFTRSSFCWIVLIGCDDNILIRSSKIIPRSQMLKLGQRLSSQKTKTFTAQCTIYRFYMGLALFLCKWTDSPQGRVNRQEQFFPFEKFLIYIHTGAIILGVLVPFLCLLPRLGENSFSLLVIFLAHKSRRAEQRWKHRSE